MELDEWDDNILQSWDSYFKIEQKWKKPYTSQNSKHEQTLYGALFSSKDFILLCEK